MTLTGYAHRVAKAQALSQLVEMIPDALSIRYNTLVYELQRRKKDVIVLSLGESFFDIPLYSFRDLDYNKGYHYSHSRGVLELRQKIAAYYAKRYGVKAHPETEILVSVGSKAIIYMALRTILCPGDEVIIFEPAWVSYTEQVRLAYAVPMMVPHYEGIARRIGNSSQQAQAKVKRWARTRQVPLCANLHPAIASGQRSLLVDILRGTLSAKGGNCPIWTDQHRQH